MTLNLYEILQKVLNESAGEDDVTNAIINHNYVDIKYSDEKNNAPNKRIIQPYAYGLSMAGNPVLRAFQIAGDTLRGEPKWKTFRLDRITYWHPRKQTFHIPPPMQGYNTQNYNDLGDGSMSKVILLAKFDGLDNTLGQEKAKTKTISNAPKLASKNVQGPIPTASQQWKRNVFTSQPNSKKYAQIAKNINDTSNETDRFNNDIWAKAEAEKEEQNNAMLQNSAEKPTQNTQGPLDAKKIKNDNYDDDDRR